MAKQKGKAPSSWFANVLKGCWHALQLCAALSFALWLLIKLSSTGAQSDVPALAENHPELAQVARLWRANQTEPALQLITQLINRPGSFSKEQQSWLWQVQADIQHQYGHFHLARDALSQAISFNEDPENRYRLRQQVEQLTAMIDSMQQERHLYQSYVNLRQTGYAQALQGDIVLLYVYLEDKLFQGWNGPARFAMREHIEQVGQWYQQQAVQYGKAPPRFEYHFYVLQTGRGISRQWLSSAAFFEEAAPLLLEQMGFQDWQQMHTIMTNSGQRQLAVIFHSNQEGRSFAQTCQHQTKRCNVEYVMLTEQSLERNQWLIPQVQAHEMAHLFGAADLYNIAAAKDYATTDLMNYYSAQLKYAEIAPITAWAIGWAPKPETPFHLEE